MNQQEEFVRRQQEIHRDAGVHQLVDCWCGHGDAEYSGEAESMDGVHLMVQVAHNEDCKPGEPFHFHTHVHCPTCAAAGKEHCCV